MSSKLLLFTTTTEIFWSWPRCIINQLLKQKVKPSSKLNKCYSNLVSSCKDFILLFYIIFPNNSHEWSRENTGTLTCWFLTETLDSEAHISIGRIAWVRPVSTLRCRFTPPSLWLIDPRFQTHIQSVYLMSRKIFKQRTDRPDEQRPYTLKATARKKKTTHHHKQDYLASPYSPCCADLFLNVNETRWILWHETIACFSRTIWNWHDPAPLVDQVQMANFLQSEANTSRLIQCFPT